MLKRCHRRKTVVDIAVLLAIIPRQYFLYSMARCAYTSIRAIAVGRYGFLLEILAAMKRRAGIFNTKALAGGQTTMISFIAAAITPAAGRWMPVPIYDTHWHIDASMGDSQANPTSMTRDDEEGITLPSSPSHTLMLPSLDAMTAPRYLNTLTRHQAAPPRAFRDCCSSPASHVRTKQSLHRGGIDIFRQITAEYLTNFAFSYGTLQHNSPLTNYFHASARRAHDAP